VVIILPRYTEKAGVRVVFLVVRKIRDKLKIHDFAGFERRPPAGNSSFDTKILDPHYRIAKQGVCNGDKDGAGITIWLNANSRESRSEYRWIGGVIGALSVVIT